ncbi:MAG TPA: hypothetical protein VMU59_12240 [Caulobacteraceae bacterium]|nr:hypothetical protein [Caulobacteraceae bacterium]
MFFRRLVFPTLACAAFGLGAGQQANAADIQVFRNGADPTVGISISGDIVNGDAEKFNALAATNANAIVFLDSAGGQIVPAMEIGKTIKLREYPTIVYKGSTCASACALIWLAGNDRVIYTGARVGFHASYQDVGGKLIEVGTGNALVGHYLSQLGFDERAVIFVTSAAPSDISWLSEESETASDISFRRLTADEPTEPSGTPELSDLMGADAKKAEPKAAYDASAKLGRNVRFFANALTAAGYKAEVNTSDVNSPKIFTGVGGRKFMLGFSSCADLDCNYVELLGEWTDVTQAQANYIFKKYALDEVYASVFYSPKDKTVAVYHYLIIGADGVTSTNMIENLEYFAREFETVGNFMNEAPKE